MKHPPETAGAWALKRFPGWPKCDIGIDIREAKLGQILVRNIDDQALETLKARALRKGSSLEAEVRGLIEREGKPDKAELLETLRRIRAMTRGPVRSLTLDEIREGLE